LKYRKCKTVNLDDSGVLMEIAYATRSRFLMNCQEVINRRRSDLEDGLPLRFEFEPGGYGGRVIVTISAADEQSFGTDWESNDPSRFPARIKAVATALFNCACFGRFEVSHDDGVLEIRRI
jgi:hypothetical protein